MIEELIYEFADSGIIVTILGFVIWWFKRKISEIEKEKEQTQKNKEDIMLLAKDIENIKENQHKNQ